MTRGTVNEVIDKADLSTFIVRGPDVPALADELHALPGIEQVTSFGTALHVVGRDPKGMARALETLRAREGISVMPGETSLEDVFIHFLNGGENDGSGANGG
jgi:ABC-2 type transport system ATP-binding protein